LCAGTSAPAGQISSDTASVNPDNMTMTVIGAWRRTTSEAHAAAWRPSMVQASGPGWTGHQVPPISVIHVSSSTKNTAVTTSTAT
jgi:hypothetical protein